jgi:hypothetical protein
MNGRDWKILELENMRRDDYYTKWAIKAKEEMQRVGFKSLKYK